MRTPLWIGGLLLLLTGACGSASPTAPGQAAGDGFITNGDVRLAYSLDLPEGTGPFPAVVVGHGSGRVTRAHNLSFAREWTTRGFAALRFDKRGVGESTGTFVGVGVADSPTVFPELASDIVAAARFLRTRPEIDARRIGLAGVSQAGWILPHAARELGDAAFVVLLSGPVCSVGLEIFYSDLAEQTSRPLDEVYALLPSFKGPAGYDPVPVLEALTTPTLWILGLDDRSIPVRTTLESLARLKASGKPFEWKTYEGLGHALSPAVWADIGQWTARFRN